MTDSPQSSRPAHNPPSILVTGATGYIGSRLVPRLLADGAGVTVLARSPHKLDDVPWRDDVTVRRGDLGDGDSLREAMSGMDVVVHLVHSMGTSSDFEREERESAYTFVAAAEQSGVGHVVHLSGLHPEGDDAELSRHLRSRAEVAGILLESEVPALVLRAGIVIGSGSASFEMIRHLTTRLPAMVTPKWVSNRVQPISIGDTVHYLSAATRAPVEQGRTVDIGGPDILRYGEVMQRYADEAGLRRRVMVPVPVLTPALSSLWMGLVTPLPSGLARPLVESLRSEAIIARDNAGEVLGDPPGGRTTYLEAVRAALRRSLGPEERPTWRESDPLGDPASLLPSDADWAGRRAPEVWTR